MGWLVGGKEIKSMKIKNEENEKVKERESDGMKE